MQWQEIDQAETFHTIKVECEVPNEERKVVVEVGSTWTLSNIQNEVSIHLASEVSPNFSFHIIEDGIIQKQISLTDKENHIASDLQPPKLLRLVHAFTRPT